MLLSSLSAAAFKSAGEGKPPSFVGTLKAFIRSLVLWKRRAWRQRPSMWGIEVNGAV